MPRLDTAGWWTTTRSRRTGGRTSACTGWPSGAGRSCGAGWPTRRRRPAWRTTRSPWPARAAAASRRCWTCWAASTGPRGARSSSAAAAWTAQRGPLPPLDAGQGDLTAVPRLMELEAGRWPLRRSALQPGTLALTLVLVLAAVALFTFVPALRAGRLNTVDALALGRAPASGAASRAAGGPRRSAPPRCCGRS